MSPVRCENCTHILFFWNIAIRPGEKLEIKCSSCKHMNVIASKAGEDAMVSDGQSGFS